LDGKAPLQEVCARFELKYGLRLELGQLRAFLRQLGEFGLLTSVERKASGRRWHSMRRLDLDPAGLFAGLARIFGWVYTRPAQIAYIGAVAISLRIIIDNWAYMAGQVENAFTSGGTQIGPERLLQIAFFFFIIPVVRELAKGTTFAHYGMPVRQIRYRWHWRIVPRFTVDLTGLVRLDRRQRLHVVGSGLLVELLIVCLSLITWLMTRPSSPLKGVLAGLVIGATLRFIFNANPLGRMDGSVVLGMLLNKRSFQERALNVSRAWMTRSPRPEPMDRGEWRTFLLYGLLVDAYSVTVSAVVLFLLGFWLTTYMAGLGLVVFVGIACLALEPPIRVLWNQLSVTGDTGMRTRKNGITKRLLWLGLTVAVAMGLYWIPYPFEVAGDFRVQPYLKREVRAELEGLIEAVLVEEGQRVSQNDVLFRLSNRALEQDLRQAEASLQREEQQLRKLVAGATTEEIHTQKQKVKLGETSLYHSEAMLKRFEELYRKGSVSEQDYYRVLKERDLDRESLAVAELELAEVLAGEREETIAAQRAEVQRLDDTVDHLRDEMLRLVLRSPISGQVTTLYIREMTGERVQPGDVMAIIEDNTRVILRIAVPQELAGFVEVGANVRARPWAHWSTEFSGKVMQIMPTAVEKVEDVMKQESSEDEGGLVRNMGTPQEKVIPVLVEVPNTQGLLRTDMTGYAKVAAGDHSIGFAFFNPILRFFRVLVWSWIP
jgi:putative peptide zinc metalloprotease protein